jgi:hypothetical protein
LAPRLGKQPTVIINRARQIPYPFDTRPPACGLPDKVCWDERHANMMNASTPIEDLTAPILDPRGDRLPADTTGTPPEVWSQASRTASLAGPAATFGARQDATTEDSAVC